MNIFNWLGSSSTATELPDLYPLAVLQKDFVTIDVQNIYARILVDVLERTVGIPEDKQPMLWDNCLASESREGVVTIVADAMAQKNDLFLVYEKALSIIRKATEEEKRTIESDYKKSGKSATGVFITFRKYSRTDMLKIYSALEYCNVTGLNKAMNLSTAIQIKLKDLRGSTSLSDSADVKAQAVAIAAGLKESKSVMLDGEDSVETAKPDLTATTSAMEFINQKRSFYLGLPASWITGELKNSSMNDTGDADARAIERGLKNYYFSIVKPIVEALFVVKTSFKSENFRLTTSALETLKTFEITSEDLLSKENKTLIVNELFGLEEDEKGDAPKKPEAAPPAAPGAPVVPPAKPPAAAAG